MSVLIGEKFETERLCGEIWVCDTYFGILERYVNAGLHGSCMTTYRHALLNVLFFLPLHDHDFLLECNFQKQFWEENFGSFHQNLVLVENVVRGINEEKSSGGSSDEHRIQFISHESL